MGIYNFFFNNKTNLQKKKDKKIKDQEVKNFAKFMKIAADVEEMKKK